MRASLVVVCAALVWAEPCPSAEPDDYNGATTNAIAAITGPDDSLQFAMLERRADLSQCWAVSGGVAYLERETGSDEAQARLSATATFRPDTLVVENRNLVVVSSESTLWYRSRLRFAWPGLFKRTDLSARVFDELYVDLEGGSVVRNNIALGIGMQFKTAHLIELYHVWVDNRGAPNDTFVLALLTLRVDPWP